MDVNKKVFDFYFSLPRFLFLDETDDEELIKNHLEHLNFEKNEKNKEKYMAILVNTKKGTKEVTAEINFVKKKYSFIKIYYGESSANFLINKKEKCSCDDILNKMIKHKEIKGYIKLHLKISMLLLNDYKLNPIQKRIPEDNLYDQVYSLVKIEPKNEQISLPNNNIFNNFNNNNFNNNNFINFNNLGNNNNFNNPNINNNYNNIIYNNNNTFEELQKLLNEERNKNIKLNQTIQELKEKLARYPFELLPGEKMMTVNFCSMNQDVTFSVICKNTDLFVKIELELYKEYLKYQEKENYFTVKGIRVDKYKSLEYNNIRNNDIILLIPLDSTILNK